MGGWRPARLNGDAGGSPLARVPVLPFRPGHRPRIPRGSNHGAVLGMFSAIFLTFCEAKACGYSKALVLGRLPESELHDHELQPYAVD